MTMHGAKHKSLISIYFEFLPPSTQRYELRWKNQWRYTGVRFDVPLLITQPVLLCPLYTHWTDWQ